MQVLVGEHRIPLRELESQRMIRQWYPFRRRGVVMGELQVPPLARYRIRSPTRCSG